MTNHQPAQTNQERCETLAGISGLVVTTRFDKKPAGLHVCST